MIVEVFHEQDEGLSVEIHTEVLNPVTDGVAFTISTFGPVRQIHMTLDEYEALIGAVLEFEGEPFSGHRALAMPLSCSSCSQRDGGKQKCDNCTKQPVSKRPPADSVPVSEIKPRGNYDPIELLPGLFFLLVLACIFTTVGYGLAQP